MTAWVRQHGGTVPAEVYEIVAEISEDGATPLVCAELVAAQDQVRGVRVLGVIRLSDVVKPGMTERFAELRAMGIKTVMITDDNSLTARAIAAQAGVDDFLAEATPEDKMALIRRKQEGGTFSIANDLAKYFAIIPAMFAGIYPQLDRLNVMQLSSSDSAILSAVVFNALIIVALIPLALRGVRYRPSSAVSLLRRNLLIYGIGGIITPFVGIFLIDLLVRLIPGI